MICHPQAHRNLRVLGASGGDILEQKKGAVRLSEFDGFAAAAAFCDIGIAEFETRFQ